jgi:hypothetical protein
MTKKNGFFRKSAFSVASDRYRPLLIPDPFTHILPHGFLTFNFRLLGVVLYKYLLKTQLLHDTIILGK